MLTFLMYGLILLALIQPDSNKKIAAFSVATFTVSIDMINQFGMIIGHGYYLFCIALTVALIGCLATLSCKKLVSMLHNALIAAIVLNSVEWVFYTYSTMINDWGYEAMFICLYAYIWYAMLGKGGADVVGRFEQLRHERSVRNLGHRIRTQSRHSDSGKV